MDDKEFIDVSDDVETLSFDDEVSDEIDAMLSQIMPEEKKPSSNYEILKDEKVTNKNSLDVYVPSIKDFNIKSERTHKIVKKVMIYSIIFILFTFEFFINKAGTELNNLRIYATNNNPIMIVQNNKYGFIDDKGNTLVNPKYSYATNYVNGYAIIKDATNLPLIIDKTGKEIVKTGTYFTLYRAGSDIIASKSTSDGLKYGILDSNLNVKLKFTYDLISYQDDTYTFVKDNVVGILNNDGKEIYSYKLSDTDDKVINVTVSTVDKKRTSYGVVKVNGSSVIINMTTGKVAKTPTLNNITVLDNNVFYEEKENGKKEYYYIENDNIIVDSISYVNLSMNSIEAGVLKGINNDFTYEFISTATKEQVSKKLSNEDAYFGENIFIYKTYDYKKNKVSFNLVRNGKVFKTIYDIKGIKQPFKNGFAIVEYDDNKYGYLNEEGNFLNDVHYIEAKSFDSYGDAVAKTDTGYGVINKNGNEVLKFKYSKIKEANENYKKNSYSNKNTAYYAASIDNYYSLYNKKGKKVNSNNYLDVIFNDSYPLLKVSSNGNTYIYIAESDSKIKIDDLNTNYKAYKNYIVINNNYYNYDGKLIYVNKSRSTEGS